ncbi:hypothetical protein MRX96_017784 [Rhipicephalus microplus]
MSISSSAAALVYMGTRSSVGLRGVRSLPDFCFLELPGVTKTPCMIPSAFRQVEAARCPMKNWARYLSVVHHGYGFG